MPQDTTKSKYLDWVKQLPVNEKPTWLGLPDNAEKVLLISEGKTSTFLISIISFSSGNKFAVDLLKCDQSDDNTLTIGKTGRETRNLIIDSLKIWAWVTRKRTASLSVVQHG